MNYSELLQLAKGWGNFISDRIIIWRLPFTEEQMKQVFDTNLIDFAVSHGFKVEKGDRNTVHVKHSGGLYLFRHGRGYYQFSGELVLPPKDKEFNRIIAYLTRTRGIDSEIVYAMINQDKIYQAVTRKNGYTFRNCAFVGYDGEGRPRYCALRSPGSDRKFRKDVENSDKTYGFCMEGRSGRVYEFEAPIDVMSHATLCKLYGIDWREAHRGAEGCLSDKALSRYLKSHPEIREIVFCYGNDVDGKDANGQPRNHGQIQANQFCKGGKQSLYPAPADKGL